MTNILARGGQRKEFPFVKIAPHPLLDVATFAWEFPRPIGELKSPESLVHLLRADAPAPLASGDEVRAAVRDLLRFGGFKPTGRSKPASEYLIKASAEGLLLPINLAVDVCNAVSLHSGLPISVIDHERARGELRIDTAPEGTSYVFNKAGQTIDLAGLICLWDDEGPCANPVKDSQRTKTCSQTQRIYTVIWGTQRLPGRAAQAAEWFQQLCQSATSSS